MQYCVFLGSLSYEAYLCIVGCIVMYIGVVGEAVCFGMNVGFFAIWGTMKCIWTLYGEVCNVIAFCALFWESLSCDWCLHIVMCVWALWDKCEL